MRVLLLLIVFLSLKILLLNNHLNVFKNLNIFTRWRWMGIKVDEFKYLYNLIVIIINLLIFNQNLLTILILLLD